MGSKERTVKSPKTEINGKAVKPAYSRWLFKNIVAVALTLFLLKVVMVLQPTYNWVCFTMLPLKIWKLSGNIRTLIMTVECL